MDERKCLFCTVLFYCKLYLNTQEYHFVLEFGVNKVEFKALLPEDKRKRDNFKKKLYILVKFVYIAFKMKDTKVHHPRAIIIVFAEICF